MTRKNERIQAPATPAASLSAEASKLSERRPQDLSLRFGEQPYESWSRRGRPNALLDTQAFRNARSGDRCLASAPRVRVSDPVF